MKPMKTFAVALTACLAGASPALLPAAPAAAQDTPVML